MSARIKGRRKLYIKERFFLWDIKEDPETGRLTLKINSNNKQFIVHYYLEQNKSSNHIIVVGSEFAGLPREHAATGNIWRRFRCPDWYTSQTITPSIVREIILWCKQKNKVVQEVDCNGTPLPLGGKCMHCEYDLRGMVPVDSITCPNCDTNIAERVAHFEKLRVGN